MIDDDTEYWVLIDPPHNTWLRVSEQEARRYPVVQIRYRHALTASVLDELYKVVKSE